MFSNFLIILDLQHVKEWEKQQFAIFNKIIGKSGQPIVEVVTPKKLGMPIQKMRTLLTLLLKKISTTGRLKKLGFGNMLIDQVLKEFIKVSGRKPCEEQNLSEGNLLKKNIAILLEWTIPEDYMDTFRAANKSVEEILEELAG